MSVKRLGQMLVEEFGGLLRQHGPEDGPYEFRARVSELRKRGVLNPDTLNFRGLLEGCMATPRDPFGERAKDSYVRGMRLANRGMFEAMDAVGASTFADIGGQLLVDHVRDNYELAMKEVDQLGIPNRSNPAQNLGTHKDPWLSRVYEEPQIVNPGQTFPWAHFSEQWATLPAPERRELGIAIEWEMIYADKTKQAFNRAQGVGEKMGLNKAKRILAVVTGLSYTKGQQTYAAQQFNYNGTGYDVYGTSGLWINKKSGLTVTTYDHITSIEELFGHMTDLATGDSIDVAVDNRKVLCVWDKQWDLHGAMLASDVLRGSFPTSGDNIQQHYNSPLKSIYQVVPSKLLYNMLTTHLPGGANLTAAQAKQYLFWGNFAKAFGYREVYPITITQAPPQNPAEFYQSISIQVKTSEYGVPYSENPQEVVQTYNN